MAKLTDFKPDRHNANKGTERGTKVLDKSLRNYGAGRSILVDKDDNVIAGNKTLERAVDIGLSDAIVVETDGTKLVVVKRTDLELDGDDGKARELALYDNRVGQLNLDWDVSALSEINAEILKGLWSKNELESLGIGNDIYTGKIVSPQYEPSGYKPDIKDIFDFRKTALLIEHINNAEGITDDEKNFLRFASQRHTVFNFRLIADYYAHASPAMQRLMEENVLVIIDYKDALLQGYVELVERTIEMRKDDYGDE